MIITGTTVVVARTAGEIVLGADSKFTARSQTRSVTGSICKIVQVGNCFAAAAGLIGNSKGTFSVGQTLVDSHRGGDSILDTVSRFEQEIRAPLIRTLEDARNKGVPLPHEGSAPLEVVFAGLENQVPVLYLRYFPVSFIDSNSISVQVVRKNCPGDCPGGVVGTALGYHRTIDSFMMQNRNFFSRGDNVAAIRQLLQMELSNDINGEIGGPITILRINRNGAHWIENCDLCPEILDGGSQSNLRRRGASKTKKRRRR